ncbi:MAG: SpoIIE family protein phosphatase, partial [Eubacterium sp.]|nr:SpoIIE family protein phosphatase [Eubacterium sp.]
YEIKMEPGSKLLVYTDGVPEATDNNNEQFGMERLLKAINSAPDGKPEDVLMLIDRDVYRFLDTAEQFDDLTMLCVGYYGANGECFPED